jgi:hypothetical protein
MYQENNHKRADLTNLVMDEEFKQLVLFHCVSAQDINSPWWLSRLSSYEVYHESLKEYFIRKYNKKPTQTDNLAFVLLLTYPENMIRTFTNFKDLKLAFNNITEESDFESLGCDIDYGMTNYTCICNERLMYIHQFRNIYSRLTIQIGSVCNERYGLISRNDPNYKTTCKKIKEAKERKKEKEEGLPEGHYENERKRAKEEKKLEKERDNLEKELKKLNKKTPDFKIGTCLFCNKNCVYNAYKYKLCMCSLCIPEEDKENKHKIRVHLKNINQNRHIYCMDDCSNCEKEFVSKDQTELCGLCIDFWKIKTCKYPRCNEKICVDINEDDDYCPDCDEKITKCSDCPIKIYKEEAVRNSGKCRECHRRFLDKKILKYCEYCEEDFEVYEKDKWRTCCIECYKDNIIEQKCPMCQDTFIKLPHETWKKTCPTCYHKNKQSKQSVSSYY